MFCTVFQGDNKCFKEKLLSSFYSVQPGASLEQTHIFVLAHILRRPIIVYGVKYYKSFRGETLGYTRFQGKSLFKSILEVSCYHAACSHILITSWGFSFLPPGVYLPLLWEQSFCWKSPIALGYTRGHFSALVAMENDGYGNRGAGANLNTDDDVTITFLPLVDSERKLLHVHFLSAQEVRGTALPWTTWNGNAAWNPARDALLTRRSLPRQPRCCVWPRHSSLPVDMRLPGHDTSLSWAAP